MQWGRRWKSVALVAAVALMLAACGEEPDDEAAAPDENGEEPADGEGGEIEIAFIPWDEAIAVSNLWAAILEDEGYEVTLTQADVAPTFEGVSSGQYDLFLDMWLPATHEDYEQQYGEELEDLGVWFDDAALTWTVPAYVDEVDSLADLPGNEDLFDGQVVGIEAGAGLTRISQEEVIPTYDLDYDLIESSTPAMLQELRTAYDAEEPVLVTLWHPHWAYDEFDLKDLEDPEGALGEAEEIHAVGRPDFGQDFPDVAEWVSNFELTADEVAELSVLVLGVEDENIDSPYDDEREAARGWIEDNQDTVDAWMGG